MTATSIFRRGGSGPYQLTNFERSQTSGCSIIDSLFACVAFQAGFSPFPLRWLRVLRILLIVPYITSLLVVSALFSLASAVALDLVLPPSGSHHLFPSRDPADFLALSSGRAVAIPTLDRYFFPPIIERAGLLLTCTETPERLFGRPYHSITSLSSNTPSIRVLCNEVNGSAYFSLDLEDIA